MWTRSMETHVISNRIQEDYTCSATVTGYFTAIWTLYSDCLESFPKITNQRYSLGNVTLMHSLPEIVYNMTNNCPLITGLREEMAPMLHTLF